MTNINPNMKPYTKLPPFKFYALTNFPFIDEDFDALTNYELMCKIVEYLNGVIENTNTCNENVQELYDCFMELQESVADQIEEGFSELNVQEEINNKLDEMVENGELNDAILYAINELNPSILNNSERVNVVPFVSNFIPASAPYTLIEENVTSTENKQLLIEILENMIQNENSSYYFINASDNIVNSGINYYKLYVESIAIFRNTGVFYLQAKFNPTTPPMPYGTQYFQSATLQATFTNELVTDISITNTNNRSFNMLTTNNINEFTPAINYAPATKKYVDENVLKFTSMPTASLDYLGKVVQYVGESDATYTKGYFYNCVSDSSDPVNYSWEVISFGGGGNSSIPLYIYHPTSYGTHFYFNEYSGVAFSGTDFEQLANIINDAHSKSYPFILVMLQNDGGGNLPILLMFNLSETDFTSSWSYIQITNLIDSYNYENMLTFERNNSGYNKTIIRLAVNISDGLVTSYYPSMTLYSTSDNLFPKWSSVSPVDETSQVTIDGTYLTNSSTDPVRLIKQGAVINISGTLETTSSTTWSTAKFQIPFGESIIAGDTSNNPITACYTTGVLYKASTSTYHFIYSNMIIDFSHDTSFISFSPIDASIQLAQGDAIRFNITYIKAWNW